MNRNVLAIPLQLALLTMPSRSSRRLWMKIRSRDWWQRVVLMEFSDSEENFWMSRSSFTELCDLVRVPMSPEEFFVRAPVPLEMRVAIAFYKLGSCAEYRVIANQFGVHKSTIKKLCIYSVNPLYQWHAIWLKCQLRRERVTQPNALKRIPHPTNNRLHR